MTLDGVGLALYAACVDFMLQLARLLHVTYRDANALLFFVVWPLVTLALLLVVALQARQLRRLRRGLRASCRNGRGA
jgi:hypothetical protein